MKKRSVGSVIYSFVMAHVLFWATVWIDMALFNYAFDAAVSNTVRLAVVFCLWYVIELDHRANGTTS